MATINENEELSLIKGSLKIVWENIGEGTCGDYHPEDPEDRNLLRYTLYKDRDGSWEQVDDASYCTLISADTSLYDLGRLLAAMLDRFLDAYASDPDASVKKLGEELSWISI